MSAFLEQYSIDCAEEIKNFVQWVAALDPLRTDKNVAVLYTLGLLYYQSGRMET